MSLHLVPDDMPLDAAPISSEMLAALPFAAYTTDAHGRITGFNQAAALLWGREPHLGEDYWCGSHKLFWADGTPMAHDQCPMAATLQTGNAVRGARAILERPDGSRVHFSPHPTALKDRHGNITGGFNVLQDITQQQAAEHAGAHFSAIVESSDDAIISKGLDGIIKSWNKGAERIFGYTAAEAVGCHVSMLIPADRQNEEPGIIERIRRGERIEHYETIRRHRDGSNIDISLTISPVKNAAGQVIGASKIARDITDRRKAEAAKDLLLHEIKHRVKNTLGTVQAIALQTFRDGPREERDAFAGRLRGMVQRALAPFQENRQERFIVTGEDASLTTNKALLLALAIHELATNAVKYGALSNNIGTVGVSWGIKYGPNGRTVAMEWRERGGPQVHAPRTRGFGSSLIERALQQEQGRACFDFRPEGVICVMEMSI